MGVSYFVCLGRYVNRIAIANHRIVRIDDVLIAFRYLDYRVQGDPIEKIMRLSAEEFIRRFLSHIPPPQFLWVEADKKGGWFECPDKI